MAGRTTLAGGERRRIMEKSQENTKGYMEENGGSSNFGHTLTDAHIHTRGHNGAQTQARHGRVHFVSTHHKYNPVPMPCCDAIR